MKIDVFDGSIVFAGGEIRGATTRTEFLSSAIGKGAREQIANERDDWRQVAFDPEPGVAATLIFQGETLHQVYVALRIASDDAVSWTTAIERAGAVTGSPDGVGRRVEIALAGESRVDELALLQHDILEAIDARVVAFTL